MWIYDSPLLCLPVQNNRQRSSWIELVLNALTQLNVPNSPSASSEDSDSVVNRGECACGSSSSRPFLKCSLLPSTGWHWHRLLPSGASEFRPPCAAGQVYRYSVCSGKDHIAGKLKPGGLFFHTHLCCRLQLQFAPLWKTFQRLTAKFNNFPSHVCISQAIMSNSPDPSWPASVWNIFKISSPITLCFDMKSKSHIVPLTKVAGFVALFLCHLKE